MHNIFQLNQLSNGFVERVDYEQTLALHQFYRGMFTKREDVAVFLVAHRQRILPIHKIFRKYRRCIFQSLPILRFL